MIEEITLSLLCARAVLRAITYSYTYIRRHVVNKKDPFFAVINPTRAGPRGFRAPEKIICEPTQPAFTYLKTNNSERWKNIENNKVLQSFTCDTLYLISHHVNYSKLFVKKKSFKSFFKNLKKNGKYKSPKMILNKLTNNLEYLIGCSFEKNLFLRNMDKFELRAVIQLWACRWNSTLRTKDVGSNFSFFLLKRVVDCGFCYVILCAP